MTKLKTILRWAILPLVQPGPGKPEMPSLSVIRGLFIIFKDLSKHKSHIPLASHWMGKQFMTVNIQGWIIQN